MHIVDKIGGRTGAAQNRRNVPRAIAHPMVHQRQQAPIAPGSHLGHASPSPVPLHMQTQQHASQLLSQQPGKLFSFVRQYNRKKNNYDVCHPLFMAYLYFRDENYIVSEGHKIEYSYLYSQYLICPRNRVLRKGCYIICSIFIQPNV